MGHSEWDADPANEAQLGNPNKPNNLVQPEIHRRLTDWWLAVQRGPMTTPCWDIASTCTVQGEPGLLLVEAKAHAVELDLKGKGLDRTASSNSQENHRQMAGRSSKRAKVWPGLPESLGGCPETTTTSCQTGLHGRGNWPHWAYRSF